MRRCSRAGKELHRLVAQAIHERFPRIEEKQPEVLARHWTEAAETESAIAEWSRAGKAAEARNAFKEALESYQQALALLGLLPESQERNASELECRQSIVRMLYVTRGYSATETLVATIEAALVAEKVGSLSQLVNWVLARALTTMVSGDFPGAGALVDHALELAKREGRASSLGAAHAIQVVTRHWRGDLAGAESHFENGRKFYDDPDFLVEWPGGPQSARGVASWNAFALGKPDLAYKRSCEMMASVNRSNPHDLVWARYYAAQLYAYLREYDEAENLAGLALEQSGKHQFPYLAALSRCVLGQAKANRGDANQAVRLIRQGIADFLEIKSRIGISHLTASLAAAQGSTGADVEALRTVEQALETNPDELLYWPEILRLLGELRLKLEQIELAKADFREAIRLRRRWARNRGSCAQPPA